MNAYILRSKPHGYNRENEFKEGKISIGWPAGSSFENLSRKEISEILNDNESEITLSMIEQFIHMPVGSIVLTPSVNNSNLIHILRTNSSYKYDKDADNNDIGNPHYINVEFIKTVPRNDLPLPVLKSLSGARKTLSRVSQYYNLLESFINNNFKRDIDIINSEESDSSNLEDDALEALGELLRSQNERIRLDAASVILNLRKF